METAYKTICNVPQVQDLETAVRLYYARNELSPADIRKIFGCSKTTATRLKNRGREQMEIDHVPTWNYSYVNTEAAFTAWGLDIGKLERALKKMRQLKLAPGIEDLIVPGTMTEGSASA